MPCFQQKVQEPYRKVYHNVGCAAAIDFCFQILDLLIESDVLVHFR